MRGTRHRSLTSIAAAAMAAAAILSLSSCAEAKVEITRTISADALADKAAEAIGNEVGQEAQADCGTKAIKLIEGNVIHCKLGPASDPSVVFDATVTLTKVDGTKYKIDVKNSQEPISPDATLPPQSK
ncbi:MAG: hypothetical protein ACTII7_04295 [Galactobacter sp.]